MSKRGIGRDLMGKGGNYRESVMVNPNYHVGVSVMFIGNDGWVCRQVGLSRRLLWKGEF